MALEHALLVALREQPAAGLDLTRRFDKSIGFFWAATHQQIYRTLGRMESDGWLTAELVAQPRGPAKKVYRVTPAGNEALSAWLLTPAGTPADRNELAVKMRGASFADDPDAVLDVVTAARTEHAERLAHYRALEQHYPDPDALTGQELDQYLVLRGGIRLEQFWVDWLTEYTERKRR